MIRSLAILLLSCLSLRAASPLFYVPTTNQLKAISIPPLSARLAAFNSGSGLTNGFDGGFWLFDATSTWAANGTNIIAPTIGTGMWHISQSILRRNNFYTNSSDNIIVSTMVGQSQPMFYITSAGALLWGPGSGAVDTSLQRNVATVLSASGSLSAPNGFRTTTMTSGRFLKSNGTDFVSADLFDTENTWTDRQVFSQALVSDSGVGFMVNGDSQKRFEIFMNGQLNWGSGSAVTDSVLYRAGIGTLAVTTNLAVSGLTPGRLVDATTGGLLVSVAAPAVDGYVLSSTIAGVKSWILNGSGGGVSSVALSLPTSVFDISGSPVTTSGTLTATFDTQTANTVFAGPTSGGAATPAFRALIASDITSIPGSFNITRTAANYTALITDHTIIGNSGGGGDITITLPVTAGFDGHIFIIIRSGGAGNVIIDQSGGGTLDTLNTSYPVRAYMWLHSETRYQLLYSQVGS